jgi:sensor histidine kinase regulating citrate/malate metabolism
MKKVLNINKTIITVISLRGFEIGAILLFITLDRVFTNQFIGTYNENLVILVILFTVLVNSVLLIKDVYSLINEKRKQTMLQESLQQVENLNRTLRAQRHDFMNHLQVVYGLMEMDEYTSSKQYIEKVFNDIQKVNNILKTANPAVNALLQAKVLFAEKRGIKVLITIKSQLTNLKVSDWEFCRVIGNIIDNAIYALLEKEGDKIIEIYIYEDIKNYGFIIKNNGPKIDGKIIDKIFKPEFTTKGEKGEGMGLAISKEVMVNNGGDLDVISTERETVFSGWVLK